MTPDVIAALDAALAKLTALTADLEAVSAELETALHRTHTDRSTS